MGLSIVAVDADRPGRRSSESGEGSRALLKKVKNEKLKMMNPQKVRNVDK